MHLVWPIDGWAGFCCIWVKKMDSDQVQVNYLHDPRFLNDVIEIICGGQVWYIERYQRGLKGMRVGPVPDLGKGQWSKRDLLEMCDNAPIE